MPCRSSSSSPRCTFGWCSRSSSSTECAEACTHSANCADDRGECSGAVLERVDAKNAFDVHVCAADESGDNGLIEFGEDGKEQFLDAIKDGWGADIWVSVAVNMQRQVPGISPVEFPQAQFLEVVERRQQVRGRGGLQGPSGTGFSRILRSRSSWSWVYML